MPSLRSIAPLLLAAPLAWSMETRAFAQKDELPPELKAVGVDEHLDGQLPLDARFHDETGRGVTLGDIYGARPAVLIFAYFRCPVVCSMIQNAAATALKEIAWTAGKEYDVIVISIDPTDTPEEAAKKKAEVTTAYGRGGTERGFHYLTGTKSEIDNVAKAAGFSYFYDQAQNQYGHPSLIMLTTPTGKMARYLYGIDFEAKDVRLGLLEASQGKSVSTVEKLILYCYKYDPHKRGYAVLATHVMQVGGGITVVLLGGFLGLMWGRERKRSKLASASSPRAEPPSGPPDLKRLVAHREGES